MTVGIIIAIWGESEYLPGCIDSIKRHTSDYGIRVIDTLEPRISLGKAWNEGMKQLDTDYYCILNDDAIVTERWIENMLEIYEKESNVGVVVPVLSNFPGQFRPFRLSIPEGRKIDTSYDPGDYTIEEIDEIGKAIRHDYGCTYRVSKRRGDDLCGACMLFHRDIFELTGGFDEGYEPAWKEDSDFFFRVDYLGYKLVLCNYSFVFHYAGKTAEKVSAVETIDHAKLGHRYAKKKNDIVKGFVYAGAK